MKYDNEDDRLDPARGIIYAVRLAFWFWVVVGAVILLIKGIG